MYLHRMGLDGVELVMEIEHAFDIRLPNDAWTEARTIGAVADVVHDHLSRFRRSFHPIERAEIVDRVRALTAKQFDVPLESLAENTNFVRDLGMD